VVVIRKNIFPVVFPAAVLFFISCASVPPLATISSNGKTVDLKLNESKRSLKEFLTIKKAVLSPDKRHLLVINMYMGSAAIYNDNIEQIQYDYILFDAAKEAIIDDRAKSDALNALKTPHFKMTGPNYYNDEQWNSPNRRYNATITQTYPNGLILRMEVKDNLTGKSNIIYNPIISLGLGLHWFIGNSMMFIGTEDTNFKMSLSFMSLPEFKKIKSYSSYYTLGYHEWNDYYFSFSSDSSFETLVVHNGRLIMFYEFKTGKYLGSLLLCGRDKWFAVSSTGEYDGTEDMFDSFYWIYEKENIPVNKFDKSFRNKKLLAYLFGLRREKTTEASRIDLAGQLIGKVREVKGAEIIVSSSRAAETMKMGDRIFVIIDGKRVLIDVRFPMQTIAKCSLAGQSAAYQGKITAGMPVFK